MDEVNVDAERSVFLLHLHLVYPLPWPFVSDAGTRVVERVILVVLLVAKQGV